MGEGLIMHRSPRTSRRLVVPACLVLLLAGWGCSEGPVSVNSESPGEIATFATSTNYVTVLVIGRVVSVTDPTASLGGAVAVGDEVAGFYTYDKTAPDTDPDEQMGIYRFSSMPCRMLFEVRGLIFASDPAAIDMDIRLRNDKGKNPKDQCDVNSQSNLQVLPGVDLTSIKLSLVDRTATALKSDALVVVQTSLADWPTQRDLEFTGPNGLVIVADLLEMPPNSLQRVHRDRHRY